MLGTQGLWVAIRVRVSACLDSRVLVGAHLEGIGACWGQCEVPLVFFNSVKLGNRSTIEFLPFDNSIVCY